MRIYAHFEIQVFEECECDTVLEHFKFLIFVIFFAFVGCVHNGIEYFDGETFNLETCVECTCVVSNPFYKFEK